MTESAYPSWCIQKSDTASVQAKSAATPTDASPLTSTGRRYHPI